MKNIGRLLIVAGVFFASCSQRINISEEKLDFCINDYSKNGCFLAINVSIDSIIHPCVVRNFELNYYFFKKKNYNQDDAYRRIAKSIVLGKEELVIAPNDTINYGFEIVKLPSTVTEDLKKGKSYVIEKYFQPGIYGGYIIRTSAIEHWREIVYTLFIKYGVICNSYDESGYIHIPEKQFAE